MTGGCVRSKFGVTLGVYPNRSSPQNRFPEMASQAEKQRITEFLDRVRDQSETKAKMVTLAELSYIHGRKMANGQKYSYASNRNLIRDYRAAIKTAFGENSALLHTMRYSDARTDVYKAHQAELREEKHRNVRPLDAEKFVEQALFLLGYTAHNQWSNAAAIAALCALTGRRPFEVACRGNFLPAPGSRHEVIFSGQTKTRDADRSMKAYTIPVLGDRELVLEAIDILRDQIDPNLENKVFTQRYAKEFGIQSKRNFKDGNGEPLKPSDLREAYAAVAQYEFCPKNVSQIQYVCDILGHQVGSIQDTTIDYLGFYIENA